MSNESKVAIFNNALKPILQTATPMRAAVNETAKLPEHPLENGSTINDHKIFNPVEVEVEMFLKAGEYKNIYQQIRQLYYSAQLVTVQTGVGSYPNMTIASLPHEETPSMFDAITVNVKFKEVRIVSAQSGTLPASSVQQPNNASTVNKGEQQPTQAKGSALFGIFGK